MAVAHLVPNAFGLRTFGPKRQMDPTKKSIRTKCVGDQFFMELIALGTKCEGTKVWRQNVSQLF